MSKNIKNIEPIKSEGDVLKRSGRILKFRSELCNLILSENSIIKTKDKKIKQTNIKVLRFHWFGKAWDKYRAKVLLCRDSLSSGFSFFSLTFSDTVDEIAFYQ